MNLVQINPSDLQNWSDTRRIEFRNALNDRVNVKIFLLVHTAEGIIDRALRRKFISEKHKDKLNVPRGLYTDSGYPRKVGGISIEELTERVDKKVGEIIKNLPTLKAALTIIDPVTAKKMDKLTALKVKAQVIFDEVQELSKNKDLDDFPEDMTLKEFKAQLKTAAKAKISKVRELEDLGKEVRQLDEEIDKKLYAGIPGIAEAIIETVQNLVELARACSKMGKEMGEKVMFGDSETAMEILKTFDKEETQMGDNIGDNIKQATALLLGAKKGKKNG